MDLRHISKALKVFLAFLLLCSFSGCAGGSPAGIHAPAPVNLTILFFNDIHGHLMPFEIKDDRGNQVEVGGIARMAYLINEIRAENNRKNIRTLVLMAGDMLQGTPMSTVFRGEPDIKCLNAMGVDAAIVGNHEFDFGQDNFLKLQGQAKFPFLSCNIVKKGQGELFVQTYLTIKLNDDLSVTIIGVTTHELLTTTKADNVAALDVLDPVTSVYNVYGKVKSLGPVILLSHCRYQTDCEIATAMPDLAAIIGGHDQILLSPYRQFGAVPVFQAFEKGRYLGYIDLQIDPVSGKANLIHNGYIPISAGMSEDPEVAAIVNDYDKRLGEQYKEVIGRAETFMNGERESIRYEETNLGNFVADIMTEHTGAPIAFINAGSLRASIKQGPVTVEDVFKVMPYANELVTTELTGSEIEEVLNRAVRGTREDEDGGFLQVSGISFEVHDRLAANIRVGTEGQPLDSEAVYEVAIPDFLSTGGDGYSVFIGKEYIQTGLPLRELIVDTIRKRGVVAADEGGRIRRER
jgi:5'-nucleotidase / UDP-sugar diphosphatase